MPKVLIYTTAICPYCVRAKHLLERKQVGYQEIRVDHNPGQLREMIQRSQRRTVPQIFIGDKHVGGFDELSQMDSDGILDPILGLSPNQNAGDQVT